MKNRLTLLLTLLLTTICFAQDDWQIHKQDNYSINYPTNWEYSPKKPQPAIQFVLFSEEASQTKDLFRENINLTLEDISGQNFNLESYTKVALEQVKSQIPSANILSNTLIKLGDKNAKEIVWTAELGVGMLLKFKQVFTLHENSAYVLTFTASTTEYDAYIIDATTILYSFKFNK
jgi:hypothetical protein